MSEAAASKAAKKDEVLLAKLKEYLQSPELRQCVSFLDIVIILTKLPTMLQNVMNEIMNRS